MRLVVHIIEWLPVQDYMDEQREAPALREALRLHGVFCTVHSTFTREAFLAAFSDVAAWHDAAIRGAVDLDDEDEDVDEDEDGDEDGIEIAPVIHVSAHGSKRGIGVDDRNEEVTWKELGDRLSDLSDEIGGVVLAMGSCRGLYAYKAAGRSLLPFVYIVGTEGKPSPAEILAGFSTLYYLVDNGEDWDDAIDVMRSASLHDGFGGLTHDEAAQLYERLRRRRLTRKGLR